MPTIWIDDTPYEVEAGQNLLHACLSLGLDIPYFCWHPALGSVGACRQCAVKQFRDENDRTGRIVMACMTPVAEGLRFSIKNRDTKEFRAMVIETLMTNHPHDCPVCDEGGECHLQDMTVMSGHNYRDYRFTKRTYDNQDLGPFINHEMNRCITCYRCVRYYRDYADGRDLNVFASRNNVYFGRAEDGALESEFSGNLVEICPTGVFTDKTLKRHFTRKWDLQTAPSICAHCSVGCNTIPGERYGELRRILNRYNGEVNGYFLCDRGRFGYEFVNGDRRIREPQLRNGKNATASNASKEEVFKHLSGLLKGKVIGIGSPRASLESNFALRSLVGAERFYSGVSRKESQLTSLCLEILRKGPAKSFSLREVSEADAVFILGEDVTMTAPRLALALRQASRRRSVDNAVQANIPAWHDSAIRELAQNEHGPVFITSATATRLEDIATKTYHGAPEDQARLGHAVAHLLNSSATPVIGLAPEVSALAVEIATGLRSARKVVIVSGTGAGSEAVLKAAANVAWALNGSEHSAGISLVVPECNSLGLGMLDATPLEEAFQAVKDKKAETVVVLENDLFRRASSEMVEAFLRTAKHVVAIDHIVTATTEKAEVVLPAGTFAEADGTLINNEGRAQRFFQVFIPKGDIQESWRWLIELARAAKQNGAGNWNTLGDVIEAFSTAFPNLAGIRQAAPLADFRMRGMKIARQSHRYSGRTAMLANISVHEPKPPEDTDSPLSFSMEGYRDQVPAALTPRFWAPGWNSINCLTKFQSEVGGSLTGGDAGVRLIEPESKAPAYFTDIPIAFHSQAGKPVLVPLHHIYGSEELSVLSEGVAERCPKPYVALNPEDAKAAGLAEGDEAVVQANGGKIMLPVRLERALAVGMVGLPEGLPTLPAISALPAEITITRRKPA